MAAPMEGCQGDEDGITMEQIPEDLPRIPPPMNVHEVTPQLNMVERVRLDCLSSLNLAEFQGNICIHYEKHIIFKGFRILERRVENILTRNLDNPEDRVDAFLVYLKLGHICLLAGDYARALSAYQQAVNMREDLFWRDLGAYFGIGIVYLHFKAYRSAIEAFTRVLYSNPNIHIAVEVHARLGVAYKAVKEFTLALKHFNAALHDHRESVFLSKTHLRLNLALCHDSAGEVERAYSDCLQLWNDEISHGNPLTVAQVQLRAAILRELGWLCYRLESELPLDSEERRKKLGEAEHHLTQSKNLVPDCGKTFYYLGRCYGEQPLSSRAHDAFVHYRCSIDKSEADADTWCSIGVLYSQQQQPMDALQAFICAVDLDPEHSAAWTNLGQLYEHHNQFSDALECYKNAIKYEPASPEPLKARIVVLERELALSPILAQNPPLPRGNQQPATTPPRLPSLKDAWHQPIPSELRQRQEEFLKAKQQRYREGSALWRCGDLATVTAPMSYMDSRPLDPTQLNMMRLLKVNQSTLNDQERSVLMQLEQRFHTAGSMDTDLPLSMYSVAQLPSAQSNLDALNNFTSLFDVDSEDETGESGKKRPKKEEPEENEENGQEAEERKPIINRGNLPSSTLGPDQHQYVSSTSDLPTTFSLLAPLRVPHDITANELMNAAVKRVEHPHDFKEIFDERVPPPRPPEPPMQEHFIRPTPLVVVESRKDATSVDLQKFCESSPIVLIRGLTMQLKMDLSLFSTKTLTEVAPEHEVEVRTQYKMPPDLNVDHLGRPTWACESKRSFTTIAKYAVYQAETFKQSMKEEAEKLRQTGAKYGAAAESAARKRKLLEESSMPMKVIKFGTNVDLSDDVKFKQQLTELAKMPPFCRVIAGCNLLSHLGHTVFGMNTVQMYMKVPGSRTPGHVENNCLASININIGPGDCEWFGVPYEYWGVIDKRCREQGIDYLKGAWWPSSDELTQMGVPVYRFTQKAGDLVWVGGGCVHWVQATGWCNNVAWNVGPITATQLNIAIRQHEWNKLQGYKSLVPMQHLFWQIAKNIRVTNQKVYSLIRGQLIRSFAYCKMIADYVESRNKQIKSHPRAKGEITHYCCFCEIEVFNILFVREHDGKFTVSCVDCARRANLTDYIVLQQIPFQEMCTIFDGFQLHTFQQLPKGALVA